MSRSNIDGEPPEAMKIGKQHEPAGHRPSSAPPSLGEASRTRPLLNEGETRFEQLPPRAKRADRPSSMQPRVALVASTSRGERSAQVASAGANVPDELPVQVRPGSKNIESFVSAPRRARLTELAQVVGGQLASGPALLGESHALPDARALVLDLIEAGRVRELFVELGSLQLSDMGVEMPGSHHDRTASDVLREHAGEDLSDHPVSLALSEGLRWIEAHPNSIPLAKLIERAQASGAAVFFYDNDPSRDRVSPRAMARRNRVAGAEFQRSLSPGRVGTLLLVGADHLDARRCGGSDNTIQATCGFAAERVHDASGSSEQTVVESPRGV